MMEFRLSRLFSARCFALALLVITACARPESKPRPVVVFGIDGATWNVIDPLIQAGKLPNLARLKAGGAYGNLDTLTPTLSPAIWTSIATGYLPERHGVKTFTVAIPETGQTRLPGSTEWREAALWSVASAEGKRVGVVNWWATFPAEPVNGFVVSDQANLHRRFGFRKVFQLTDTGLESIGRGETHPPTLLTNILEKLGTNLVLPPDARRFVVDPMPANVQRELDAEQQLVRERALSMLKFLMLQDHAARLATKVALEKQGVPDLLMLFFSGLDGAEHRFWSYYQPGKFSDPPPPADVAALRHVIPGYYAYVDSIIGDLLTTIPKDALIVVLSDHGHGPNPHHRRDAPIGQYGRFLSGVHEGGPPGILLLAGPGVGKGPLRKAGVLDIAPTLLAAIGVRPTAGMPGRVIFEAFDGESRHTLPSERVARVHRPKSAPPPAAAPTDPELIEKLRSLGYIR